MPSTLPPGDPAPTDGRLPETALAELPERALGIYLHVPFCSTRCGYCDFNTYTAAELGPGASRTDYLTSVLAELDLARTVLGPTAPSVSTVFVGGGTPTLLPPGQLVAMIAAVEERFGLTADAEITTEANPESVDRADLDVLRAGGFNRISFGMQSAVPHVLATLDRVHSPGRPQRAVTEARAAGFESISLDLIYGAPGESAADWQTTLDAALTADPDHVSAYALIVEEGTRLAAQIRRGELAAPDDDDQADKYLAAENVLQAAGLSAYEVSNWARTPADRCRHNLGYWRGDHWWGVGPGAHSHVGGVRWWNVKRPTAYAQRLAAGASPAYAREQLSPDERQEERIMLETRLTDGLPLEVLGAAARSRLPGFVDQGWVEPDADRVILTVTGRLMADAVVRDLIN